MVDEVSIQHHEESVMEFIFSRARHWLKSEIISESEKSGTIVFLYSSDSKKFADNLFYNVKLEIKEDRFRVTISDVGAYNSQTGNVFRFTEKTKGWHKVWFEDFVEQTERQLLELKTIEQAIQEDDF